MANENDDVSVQVDDLDTVVVDVDNIDNTDPKDGATKVVAAEVDSEPKPKRERKRPAPEPVVDAGPTPEQLIEEAKAAAKASEEARAAAEATARAERDRAEKAEKARLNAQKEAQTYRDRAATNELALVENSITAAQKELEAEQENYTRAAEAGEFAKMAAIQIKIAKAAAALDRLEDHKSTIEARGTTEQPTEGAVSEPDANSPQEQFLRQLAPAAQSWMRQHLDCLPANLGGDNAKNAKMMSGHYSAVAQNIQQGSPDYFRVIEEHLGLRQPVASTEGIANDPTHAHQHTSRAAETTRAEPARRAAPAPAAPVSRDAPSASGAPQRGPREVRLTRDQQEAAKASYPHLTDQQAYGLYARSLLELEAEGKLGRTTH